MNAGHIASPSGPLPYRGGRKRRISTVAALTALAGVIACTLLVAFGAEAIVTRASCTHHPAVVTIDVSPDIAPAISHVGKYFNAQQHSISGHCALVRIASAPSAAVAAQVSGQARAPAGRADAWIPDSSLWVDVARSSPAGTNLVQPTGLTVARSPLMIVMPRSVAAQMPAFGTSVGWQFLLPESDGGPATALGLHVEFPDPALSSAGLATLIELQQRLGSGSAALDAFTKFVFNVQVTSGSSSTAALSSLASLAQPPRDGRPVTVIAEQAVAQYDKTHPAEPLSGRYPAQGTYELDYPYVLTGSNPLMLRAARAFETTLRSAYATSYVRYEGFRSASGSAPGWIGQYGLTTGQPQLTSPTAPGQAETALQAWQRLGLGSRDLVLVDVSAQMAAKVAPGGPTVEQVLAQAAGFGLSQFPNSTQMGLWTFASHLNGSLPYQELVPVGPLLGEFGLITRRQQILRVDQTYQPVAGAPAALYGAILAGFKRMAATYQPRYSNALLIMTLGIDNAPGDISAAALVRQLRTLYNPNRRVEIIPVMLGGAGNFTALQQIAAATGGQAYKISSPSQITKVFFSAIARRICTPGCGA